MIALDASAPVDSALPLEVHPVIASESLKGAYSRSSPTRPRR